MVPGYPGTFEGGSGYGSGAPGGPVWQGSNLSPSTIGVSVGGVVWVDTVRDGRLGPDEPVLAGVSLFVVDTAGMPAKTVDGGEAPDTVTDATGHYLFPRLKPGVYRVYIRRISGYAPTRSGIGSRFGDSSTGSAASITLAKDGSFDLTLDFGYVLVRELPATGGSSRDVVPPALLLLMGGIALVRMRRYARRR